MHVVALTVIEIVDPQIVVLGATRKPKDSCRIVGPACLHSTDAPLRWLIRYSPRWDRYSSVPSLLKTMKAVSESSSKKATLSAGAASGISSTY